MNTHIHTHTHTHMSQTNKPTPVLAHHCSPPHSTRREKAFAQQLSLDRTRTSHAGDARREVKKIQSPSVQKTRENFLIPEIQTVFLLVEQLELYPNCKKSSFAGPLKFVLLAGSVWTKKLGTTVHTDRQRFVPVCVCVCVCVCEEETGVSCTWKKST